MTDQAQTTTQTKFIMYVDEELKLAVERKMAREFADQEIDERNLSELTRNLWRQYLKK